LIFVLKTFGFLGKELIGFIAKGLQKLGNFSLRFFALPIYRSFYFIKRRFLNFSTPAKVKFIVFLLRRHFIHGIVILISFTIAVNSLQAKDIRDEHFGESTIVYVLFQGTKLGEISEEKGLVEGGVFSYFDQAKIKAEPLLTDQGDMPIDALGSVIVGGAAVAKPQIIQTAESQVFVSQDKITKYIVKSGDTVSAISKKFKVSVDTILWQNNLRPTSRIRPGDALEILPISGLTYKVRWGQTLGGIAAKYGVEANEILKANGLSDPSSLRANQILIIPGAKKASYYAQPTYVSAAPVSSVKKLFATPGPSPASSATGMIWPAAARHITQYYSWRHSGLDIGGKIGTALYASDTGTVTTAKCGWNGGYGCYIDINHGTGIKTRYAHNSKLIVGVGAQVTKGQTIALMGSTGRSSGPHVHFEVIVNGRRVNPLGYIK